MTVIACLAQPGTHTSALFGCTDVLSSAQDTSCAEFGYGRPDVLDVRIVGETLDPVMGWKRRLILPDTTLSQVGVVDAIYIPAIGEIHSLPFPTNLAVLEWIRSNFEAGTTLAAVGSGVCLLAEAGVLDGEKATTHFAWAEEFKHQYPRVTLHECRAMVFSGPAHRIVTTGGGALWTDLALFLISRFLGHEAALRSAKYYLVDWGARDQVLYSSMEATRQHYDAQVKKAQCVIAQNLANTNVLQNARDSSELPVRTFERRFKAATGTAVSKYIQQMRVERAKVLLETVDMAVESLAYEVGYVDTTSFRRLFIRLVGMTPSEYRKRYGGRR
ncbi:GlxA family transcriptional regulator [Pseudovibrio sp. Alg231-02]|uniref:GlxA family transcriptional regulator n=1 Tax=Pseudovibrio sp. Alg231-02 TaxID=1922223 RepID=UPI000D55EEE0|nr:helix-turn-helix domain-containing protein [Pseudovibrio sp. Alg231-02]